MDHCYSDQACRQDDVTPAKGQKHKDDHSYFNNRETLQCKDHSYFQFAKKTPPVHNIRFTVYKDKCSRSTPLVSRDHTYVRALQLRQNSVDSAGPAPGPLCKLCSAPLPPVCTQDLKKPRAAKKENQLDPVLGGFCVNCVQPKEALKDHSYNQHEHKKSTRKLKPTNCSDHTYMTFMCE